MKAYYHTFGCKVNQYETEMFREKLELHGFETVSELSSAEIYIVNSCTVTQESDKKLHQLLRRIKRLNPKSHIVLVGCYPQAPGFTSDLVPEADLIIGAAEKNNASDIICEYIKNGVKTAYERRGFPKEYPSEFSGGGQKTRGIIKIQDGCDMFCSYCVIPFARGRSRSKPLDEIEREAKSIAESGHRELVVVGINLSDYGKGTPYNLADAIAATAKSGVERIRLGSLEPEELTPDIIDRLANIGSLCPHFHLALQSGCDKTLKEMRRKYDKSKYFTLVNLLRTHFPDCAITTDIMTGFPGETEQDHRESLEFVKLISFANAHVFPYSMRDGTAAAKRSNQLPIEIKAQRAKEISEAVSASKRAYLEHMIGSTQKVLFELEKATDCHQGHAANYSVVKIKRFTDTLYREMLSVNITGTDGEVLFGELAQR